MQRSSFIFILKKAHCFIFHPIAFYKNTRTYVLGTTKKPFTPQKGILNIYGGPLSWDGRNKNCVIFVLNKHKIKRHNTPKFDMFNVQMCISKSIFQQMLSIKLKMLVYFTGTFFSEN